MEKINIQLLTDTANSLFFARKKKKLWFTVQQLK